MLETVTSVMNVETRRLPGYGCLDSRCQEDSIHVITSTV